jgi:hypothetical protein
MSLLTIPRYSWMRTDKTGHTLALSNHPWKEPLIRVSELAIEKGIQRQTPMIGEPVRLKDETQDFTKWWEDVD